MTQKHSNTGVFRAISVILSIVFMWGFGIMLLVVILNCALGYSDNKADFTTLFLSMTETKEQPLVEAYLQMYVRNQQNEDPAIGLTQALHTYQSHFSPENTNFRFTAMDKDGNLLLSNDPHTGREQPMLASHVISTEVTLKERSYQIQKHFDDPTESYSLIAYGDASQYLDTPQDYQLWYFTNNRVDSVYHEGLNLRIYDDYYSDYRVFSTEEEAKDYDYQSVYGDRCEWTILASTDVPDILLDETEVTVNDPDEELTQVPPANPAGNTVVVRVDSYASCTEQHDSLDHYYEMKRSGRAVNASDPELEALLMSGLDITIRANHTDTQPCYIRTYLPEKLEIDDTIRSNFAVFSLLFRHSEWFVIMMFVLLLLTFIASIAMCSVAGHPDDSSRIEVPRVHTIAYEFFWFLPPVSLIGSMLLLVLLSRVSSSYRIIAIFCIGLILVIAACCVLWLYTTAVRMKAGTFWHSFGFIRVFTFLFGMFRHRTFTMVVILLLTVLLFFLNAAVLPVYGPAAAILIISLDLLTVASLIYCIYCYFELHRHVREMKTGNFEPASHPLPLGGDFASFDDALNEITDSISDIVAKQTKAEHLRTELITNVSHDLKTPLTSIVNYVDLLSREPMQNESAAEYLEVLRRQAARLKKLTIDLVDASKASTGNLTVELMPTDLQVLISQIAGEYEGHLAAKDLSLVLNAPEEPLMILADGRQIWRVFDNLLNNACKYALAGTRVYLDIRSEDDRAKITLKNISASPLNVSPDELMERFVRGDASRHTEGSGLGLSIARDLTALQNGILTLQTDGDLFKAHLEFPIYHAPEAPQPEETPEPPEEVTEEQETWNEPSP